MLLSVIMGWSCRSNPGAWKFVWWLKPESPPLQTRARELFPKGSVHVLEVCVCLYKHSEKVALCQPQRQKRKKKETTTTKKGREKKSQAFPCPSPSSATSHAFKYGFRPGYSQSSFLLTALLHFYSVFSYSKPANGRRDKSMFLSCYLELFQRHPRENTLLYTFAF